MKEKKESKFNFHPVLREMKYNYDDEIDVEFVQEYLRKQRKKNTVMLVFQIFLWFIVAMNFLFNHNPNELVFYFGFLGIVMVPIIVIAYKKLKKRYTMEDNEIEKIIKKANI
ncbi:MAG: hypothetical protein U9R42_12085 [Bacteroidota bacterium]|nr:hypothetical protein [Bacteroidota bacterium]